MAISQIASRPRATRRPLDGRAVRESRSTSWLIRLTGVRSTAHLAFRENALRCGQVSGWPCLWPVAVAKSDLLATCVEPLARGILVAHCRPANAHAAEPVHVSRAACVCIGSRLALSRPQCAATPPSGVLRPSAGSVRTATSRLARAALLCVILHYVPQGGRLSPFAARPTERAWPILANTTNTRARKSQQLTTSETRKVC